MTVKKSGTEQERSEKELSSIERSNHPGKRSRKGRSHLRGRQPTSSALKQVCALLGDQPRRRDLLIEFLHLINDKYGAIDAEHLRALAHEMKLSQAEVYETASFYAHFDVLKEAETIAPITIRVCDSLSCVQKGALQLKQALEQHVNPSEIRVIRAPCMGRCDTSPNVEVKHQYLGNATVDSTILLTDGEQIPTKDPAYQDYAAYVGQGGYQLYHQCINGERSYQELSQILKDCHLRGLGGAGFPLTSKWQFVRAEPKPRYLVVNGDEGEPGTYKDRYYLEHCPHQFLEGALISAWVIEAKAIYIYLRDEYPQLHRALHKEIEQLEQAGEIAPGFIHLRRGAGAYICGEESALIESLEGKPGKPRHRPPYVAQVGLFNRPTLVNNVETIYWIRDLVEGQGHQFTNHGRHGHKGVRSFSVSGRVKNPGVHLAPAGITMQELLDEYCGGMEQGHTFNAYLPGGASGGILPALHADVPLDFDTLQSFGCFIGSAAIIVLSDKDDLTQVAQNLMAFFADESCGQCTPCRVGTEKMLALLKQKPWDEELIQQLSAVMRDASICGLGQTAPNSVTSILKFFPSDVAVKKKAKVKRTKGAR